MKLKHLIAAALLLAIAATEINAAATIELKDSVIRDKIKGGWVGQVVGCTYGGPTEFEWNSTFIQDYVPIVWNDTRMLYYYEDHPGLYDDIYMDLTFLSVLAEDGPDASINDMAIKFANAGFTLWHANQAARWNILNGIMPPESGHWKNNPHADDIDFQIESDFIGLICPGMPQTANQYADKVGHIMNYGDGVYGGMFVASMYAHAFIEKDIVTVVEKALESIPAESRYAKTITDVLAAWRMFPADWQRTWFETQRRWGEDIGCPDGALRPFNIDASFNGACIVIGLLYGAEDMTRTIDIATRCGADSDCNPSNAAGILGTLKGFSNIPDYWKQGLDKVENLRFSYSDYSLIDTYAATYKVARQLVERNGGSISGDTWTIAVQQSTAPETVEIGFESLVPVEFNFSSGDKWEPGTYLDSKKPFEIQFDGAAYVINGRLKDDKDEALCRVTIDGKVIEEVLLKGDYHDRRTPLFWYYDLEPGSHILRIDRIKGKGIPRFDTILIYDRAE